MTSQRAKKTPLSKPSSTLHPEEARLDEDSRRTKNWKRWGPYLPERQWGTVREDYSDDGDAWNHFPFEHAHLRAYRWGEDGLLGLTDREGRLCFSTALWNGQDEILKERLFGLTNNQGNHGEDCKELYYYLDATPTYTYSKALYKYPQSAFPYEQLRQENAARGHDQAEYEILDTGVFDNDRYFDVQVEYAKNGPNDLLIRITATNRGDQAAFLELLPKIWFRNTWIWGCQHEGCTLKPSIQPDGPQRLRLDQESLGTFYLAYDDSPELGLAENETNREALYQSESYTPYTKGSFAKWIIQSDSDAVNQKRGTMAMLRYPMTLQAGESQSIRLRLFSADEIPAEEPFASFDKTMTNSILEADSYWKKISDSAQERRSTATKTRQAKPKKALIEHSPEIFNLLRQTYAGLLWSKQFYHYSVSDWLKGDIAEPPPSKNRLKGRNAKWTHLFNRDIISMPDKWEYPWYAAWDLAFHMIPFVDIDPAFAKQQLELFLREWYMHPNGQIPAYEWALGDVNPPTHAWACWQVYKIEAKRGHPDTDFLKRVFNKLLLNFTWWVNRKDPEGNNIFGGGFLGLDNIGLFDRSKPLPGGAHLHQADGTAWMAFYSVTMLTMALELSKIDPTYEDIASKFFEHYMGIADAINHFGENGLWDKETGFYYDEIQFPDQPPKMLKVRSLIGLLPMIAVSAIDTAALDNLPGFRKRMDWYLTHRKDITSSISCQLESPDDAHTLLLALPTEDKLRSLLGYLFDEDEFLSPFGIRSLSKYHQDHPFSLELDGELHEIRYSPGDSTTFLFGGNSNWRGPIWFPLNYLIIRALRQYGKHYGAKFTIEYPTHSGQQLTLHQCADDIEHRLATLFLKDEQGVRPYDSGYPTLSTDPNFESMHQFFEYFNGDTGTGQGASHQTGWTALIASML